MIVEYIGDFYFVYIFIVFKYSAEMFFFHAVDLFVIYYYILQYKIQIFYIFEILPAKPDLTHEL